MNRINVLKTKNAILIKALNPELVFKKIIKELLFDVILHYGDNLSCEDIKKNAINIYYLEANLECDFILDNSDYFEEELEILIKDLEDHVRLFRKNF